MDLGWTSSISKDPHATKVQLKGVSLDVGRPLLDQGRSLRLALGVEQCDCPKEYSSTSCQDPGKGYYRVFDPKDTEQVEGEIENKLSTTWAFATIAVKTRQDHIAISVLRVLWFPKSPERMSTLNFAITCSVNERDVFSCECQKGYTGPKCDKCDYGYYGNPRSEGGKCVPCNCNPHGSLSDQCNPKSGQCACASPEICQPRHILTKEHSCKNCEDRGCTSYLLNFVQLMENVLWDANVTELDPAPNIRLTNLKRRTSVFEDEINNLKNAKGLAFEADNLIADSMTVETSLHRVQTELEDVIGRLRSYSVSDMGSEASVGQALAEAKKALEEMKRHDFGEIDIKARTELSHARILDENMKKLIYGTSEIPREHKLNDLLKYIDNGLGQSRLTILLTNRGSNDIRQSISTYESSRETLNEAWEVFSSLPDQYQTSQDPLSSKVIQPCEKKGLILSRLSRELAQLLKGSVGNHVEQTLKAVNVYGTI
ncbi:Laminin subunit alpha1like, partial [Caligus rogercresseyi]